MHLLDRKLKIGRPGYVKTGDELDAHKEDVERIVEHHLRMLDEELDQAGYTMEVTPKPSYEG